MGYLWLTLLSLSLLLGGPGHVAFHGSGDHCGSPHAEHSHHVAGSGECHSAMSAELHDVASVGAPHEHEEAAASELHEGTHEHDSRVALKPSRSHSDHDCIHCFQVAGETPVVSIPLSGDYSDSRVRLEFHREIFSLGSFDVPSPRGPPSAA